MLSVVNRCLQCNSWAQRSVRPTRKTTCMLVCQNALSSRFHLLAFQCFHTPHSQFQGSSISCAVVKHEGLANTLGSRDERRTALQDSRARRHLQGVKPFSRTQTSRPQALTFVAPALWPRLLRIPHPMFAHPVPIPHRDPILLTLIVSTLNYIFFILSDCVSI
jgi:hypothetical protein